MSTGLHDDPAASGQLRADEVRRKAAAHAAEAEKLNRLADKYEKGNEGERRTARVLDVLEGAGWFVLNDRYKGAGSRANIDHVVVGPPGVCVIDSKNWSGRATFDDSGLRVNGYNRNEALIGATAAAGVVAELAHYADAAVIVAPVLCFVSPVGLPGPGYHQGVVALELDQLLPWLTSLPPALDPQRVQRLASSLDAALSPRSGPSQPLTAVSLMPEPRPVPAARCGTPPATGARRQTRAKPVQQGLAGEAKDFMSRLAFAVVIGVLLLVSLPVLTKVVTSQLQDAVRHSAPIPTPAPVPVTKHPTATKK